MIPTRPLLAATVALLLNTIVCQAQLTTPAAPKDMMAGHEMMSADPGHPTHDGANHPHRCMHKSMMGGGAMPHMLPLPSLPPGNAKLELQMRAEILQKVGEILNKYAAQVKDLPAAP
jgi:hypothetical protein